MSRITLTMVVKDAQASLPAVLQSVAGVVDEIVIVDTGSADGTARIAAEAGAIVVHHPAGDVAEARSAGLAAATGAWLLILGADERLAPGGGAVIRAGLAADDFDCGMLVAEDGAAPSARLLRRTEDLRWEGASPEPAASWLTAPARRSRTLDTRLVGAVATDPLQPLRQRLADEPDDVRARVALARALMQSGEVETGRAHIASAWSTVQSSAEQRGEIVTLVTLRCIAQIDQQDLAGARQTLTLAEGWGADHPNLALLRGTVLEQLAHHLPDVQRQPMLEEAIAALRRCLEYGERDLVEAVIPGAMSWAARARLGVCYQALGLSDAARQEFGAAFVENPDLPEVRLGLADALMETDPSRALRLVEPIVATSGIDGWLLKAGAHEVKGEDNEMARALLAGLQHIRDGFAAGHRRALMDELVSLLGILQGSPRPGRGAIGALAGLMSGYPPPAGSVFPAPLGSPTARRLSKVIAYLRLRGEAPLLAALAGEPIEGLYPGIRHLLSAGN